MGGHELVEMLHQEYKDAFAKHLCRTFPLFDNTLDEALLDHEGVATWQFSRAGSGVIECESQDKVGVARQSTYS
jgi:hypothetical protein